MHKYKLMLVIPIFTIFFYVNMAFILMMEMPVLENKDNPRKVTKQVEKFYCWLGDDVCKGFREFFLLEKNSE
ncbi:hypothetical protein [uncultured Campylobacter sp.]|uniref:hypothetical protein n=1 Tax=uncultured Campylobacter sp. TaxID=218934 RepID=UPI0025E22C41|nr:hypothetical protein [uncultured Campylobacter sp.]